MKKGFTLILLLIAAVMVFGVAPALATAPPVGNLPRIVFSDTTGEIEHAFDLDQYIDWYGIRTTGTMAFNLGVDPYDPDEGFHVYLTDGLTGPAPVIPWDVYSTQPISTKLTGGDLGGLATPVLPLTNETAKNIYRNNGRHWLSLTNDGVAGLTTIYLGAYVKSDITTGGLQSFGAVSLAIPDSLAQYGHDFSAYGFDDFEDWWTEGRAGLGYFEAIEAPGVGNSYPWSDPPGTDDPALMAWDATATYDANAMAYGVATAVLPDDEGGYVLFIPNDGGAGLLQPVFEAKALMRNDTNQSAYEFSPGWQLIVINAAQTHLVTVTNQLTETLTPTTPTLWHTPMNGPCGDTSSTAVPPVFLYEGNDYAFTARLYWETPMGMSQMLDGEGMSSYTAQGNAVDGRDYGISWAIVDSPNPFSSGNDQGIFQLVALTIRTYEGSADLVYTPHMSADGINPAAWDAARIGEWDLNTRVFPGFYPGVVQGVNGTVHGTGTPEGDALVDGLRIWAHDADLEPGSFSSYRYQLAVCDTTIERNRVPLVPDTLLCAAIACMSEDVETAPSVRLFHSQQSWNNQAPQFRWITWEEFWGPRDIAYKHPDRNFQPRPVDWLGNPLPAPGVPPVAGTVLRSYMWTHKVFNTLAENPPVLDEFTVPELAVYSLGLYGPHALPANDWADETGYLEFRDITYYTVDTDQTDTGPYVGVGLNPLYDPPAIP